jgi:hypothetical protein
MSHPDNVNEGKLGLRVFKRSNEMLILLWDRVEGANTDEVEISFTRISKSGDSRPQPKPIVLGDEMFTIDQPSDIRDLTKDTGRTVICVIKEDRAKLESTETYYVKVRYAGREVGVKVLPSGVLPDNEKDNSDRNIHLFAWNKETSKWRKLSGAQTESGDFALLTTLAPCPNCGYDGDKKF